MSSPTPERPMILIVDDEVRILTALRRTLRREGYEILTAETTAEALTLLSERPVDLVLEAVKPVAVGPWSVPATAVMLLLSQVPHDVPTKESGPAGDGHTHESYSSSRGILQMIESYHGRWAYACISASSNHGGRPICNVTPGKTFIG